MRHATLNENVVEILYFDAPPDGAVEVPDFVEPGYRLVDGEFVAPNVDLEPARIRALQELGFAVLKARGQSPGVNYADKRDEALEVRRMVDREEDPNALDEGKRIALFPNLAASIGIETETLTEAADLILKRYTEDANLDNPIERARLAGKSAIKFATSLADIKAASQEAINALEAIGADGG